MSRVFMKEEPWNPSEVFLRQGAICWTFDGIDMFRSSPLTKSFTESCTQSPYIFTRPDRWLSSHICRTRFFQIFRKEEINLFFQQRESELDQYLAKKQNIGQIYCLADVVQLHIYYRSARSTFYGSVFGLNWLCGCFQRGSLSWVISATY